MPWRARAQQWWQDYQWFVVGFLWLAALALGYLGFARHFAALGETRSPPDLFYLTLQLFVLESGSIPGPKGWELELARLLAPGVAGYTVVQALALIFSEQLQLLGLRFASDHVVICGLGRKGYLLAIAFAPGGDTLASGSGNTVQLWRASDGTLLRSIEGHSNSVHSVAFSPDGETLASGSWDNTVKLWRVADGSLVRTLEGHTDRVWSVDFSTDGQILASGSWDNTVKLWRVSDGTLLSVLEGHSGNVDCVSFSPDGSILASGDMGGTVILWDVESGQRLRTLRGHGSQVRSVTFSPDGSTLASGSEDDTVILWNVQAAIATPTPTGVAPLATSQPPTTTPEPPG